MPAKGEPALDDLVRQLQRVWASGLRAVVLYGSGAGGEHIAGRSDYNVLVLVDAASLTQLQAGEAALRPWRKAGHPPPQVMTVDEWRAGVDAFPMEYADILDRHRVLFGEAPFAGLAVDTTKFRLQLEHQARATLQRLRRRLLSVAGDGHVDALADSVSGVMVVFRATERLHGASPSSDNEALVRAVAARAGFDGAPFLTAVAHVRSNARLGAREAAQVLPGYLAGLERLNTYLDTLEA